MAALTNQDFMFRMTLSLVLGLFIGFERQITGQVAEIRIKVLICMGAWLFVLRCHFQRYRKCKRHQHGYNSMAYRHDWYSGEYG